MMAPERSVICGSFRALELALCERLRVIRTQSRLGPVAVVVPGEMLREHLVRAVAADAGGHANVHFLTFAHMAERLAGLRQAARGMRPQPRQFETAALARAARRRHGELHYFASLANGEGFQEAMIETVRDLREAGLRPGDVKAAAGHMREGDLLGGKLREVALLWDAIEREKAERGFFDPRGDLPALAAEEVAGSRWMRAMRAFLLYGFYDFTRVQQRLLEACFEVVPSTVFYPYGDEEVFSYARPGLEWLLGLGFARSEAAEATARTDNALGKLQARLFRPIAGESAEGATSDEGVCIVSAPGELREAREVVREVVYDVPGNGAAGRRRVGILLRSTAPYASLLREAFTEIGVNGYFHACLPLAERRAGKTLLLFAELLGGRLKRTDVMDFLAVANLRSTGEDKAETPPVELWDQFSIEAGVVEGDEEWRTRLRALAASDAYCGEENAARVERLAAFRRFIDEFLDEVKLIRDDSGRMGWRERTEAVCGLLRRLLVEDDDLTEALERVGALADLDAPGWAPDLETFCRMLRRVVIGEPVSAGRFERAEPTVAPLMQARGVPFDVVVLPGMVEKVFPQAARQDPILLDAERIRLGEVLSRMGMSVSPPLKRRRREEELLLFALAVQSAREKLVLTFPRIEPQSARMRVPSYFLLRSMEAIRGEFFDFDRLDESVRKGRIGRFVRMTQLEKAVRDRAAHPLEYDMASLARARADGTPNAMAYLGEESVFFRRAVEAESARYGVGRFTRYDGVVESDDVRALLKGHLAERMKAVSPSALEAYAACPFRYLVRDVLGIEPVEEPERVAVISALDRGSLVHDILWEFLSRVAREGRLPVRAEDWPRLEETARRWFRKYEQTRMTGYPLTWRIETQRILEDLRGFLLREAAERTGFRPARFEVGFGVRGRDNATAAGSFRYDLGDGEGIGFCGRIDRIDLDEAGERCRVIDYKTGSSREYKENAFSGGRALQLPVYLPAARELLNGVEPEWAEYYFATERGGFRRVRFTWEAWRRQEETFRMIVRTIVEGIRAGRFYAVVPSDERCLHCDCRRFCGSARGTSFKWRIDAANTRSFLEMSGIE